MRGYSSKTSTNTVSDLTPDDAGLDDSAVMTDSSDTPNLKTNTQTAEAPGSIVAWLTALILCCAWAGIRKNEKVMDALEPHKVLDATLDVFSLAAITAVGLKGIHILLTKLSSMKIPVLSKIAGFFLPIYS